MSDEQSQAWAQMQAEAEAHEAEQAAADAAQHEAAMEAEQAKPTMQPFRAWVAWHPTQGIARFNHNGWFIGEDFEGAHEELTDFEDDDFLQYCKDNPEVAGQMTYSQWLSSRGWRIVEVEVREVGK